MQRMPRGSSKSQKPRICTVALLAALVPLLAGAEVFEPEGGAGGSDSAWDLGQERSFGLGLGKRSLLLDQESGGSMFQLSRTGSAEAISADPERPVAVDGSGRTLEVPVFSQRLKQDFAALVMSPGNLDRRGWRRLGAGVALVGVVSIFDDDIRSAIGPGGNGAPTASSLRPLGQEASFAILGGSWLIGRATGKERYKSIARDGLEASILAAGFIGPLGKSLTGRRRPRDAFSPSEIQSSNSSFPSGEVTQAFAVASVVSEHSRKRWVKALAWGLASSVAWQRMELDAHWASDATAGALLGSAMGRWVVNRHRSDFEEAPAWSIAPQVGESSAGLAVRWSR